MSIGGRKVVEHDLALGEMMVLVEIAVSSTACEGCDSTETSASHQEKYCNGWGFRSGMVSIGSKT